MNILEDHANTLRGALDELGALDEPLRAAAESIAQSYRSGGKLLAAGNGGSAAEAQHLTGELLGRLQPSRERRALPAVALHADTSTLTAVANDYGYEEIFARQVEGIGRPGDVLVVLSTSGASPNLVRAVEVAQEQGITTVGLLGRGPRPLHERCDHVLAAPSYSLAAVQECHLILVHVLVEHVEDALSGGDGRWRVTLEHRLGVMQGRLVPSSTGELQCSPGRRWPDEFVIAADLGLAHVELLAERVADDTNPIWSTAGRRKIGAIVASTGVDAPSLCMNEPLSTPLEGVDAGTMVAARLAPVVCESPVRIVVLPLDEASGLDVLDWTQAAQGVRALAARLQERGARVAVELNVSAADSMRFLDLVDFDTVGLCYDVGNATGLGYSAPTELRLLGSRVVHVHAKDKDATGSNVRFGTGVVPFGPALAALRDIGFDGLVTMEATRGDDPVITAEEHRAWLLALDVPEGP